MAYKFDDVKVLLVEDMHPILEITKSVLQVFGFKKIIIARSGNEAFTKFCDEKPDLVITDWLMDDGDGLELIKKIRYDERSPDAFVPVILLTGYSNRNRIEQARDKGVTEILAKPFTSRDLYNRIFQIIEKPRQFVKVGNFFGPDRRRREVADYEGPIRRKKEIESLSNDQENLANELLNTMKKDTKDI